LRRAAVGGRRRFVAVIVIIITLAVFRIYRIATSKLFLKPATNRLEDPGGSMGDLLAETRNRSTESIRPFTNRSSGLLLGRIFVGRIILLILRRRLSVVSWRTAIWTTRSRRPR
jgi:hypothetical protein